MKNVVTFLLILLSQVLFSQAGSEKQKGDSESKSQEYENPIYLGFGGAFVYREMNRLESDYPFSYSFVMELEKQISRASLKTGLTYVRKGSSSRVVTLNTDGDVTDYRSSLNAYYLVLPFDLSFRFGKKRNFSIEGGGYAGYLLRFYSVIQQKEFNLYDAADLTNDDIVTRLSLGIHFAIKYDVYLSSNYKLGVSLFDDNDLTAVYSNPSPLKNNTFGIKLILNRKL